MTKKELPAISNSHEVFQLIQGQKIQGVIEIDHAVYFIFEDGQAIGLTSLGGNCSPAYWIALKSDVKRIVEKRKKEIEDRIKELGGLTQVEGVL